MQEHNTQEFSNIPTRMDAWEEVLAYGRKIERPKGYILLDAGTRWDVLYYLVEGEVQLVRILPDGRKRLLWISTAPNVVGEGPFFDQIESGSALIVSRPSVLYAFTRAWVENTLLVKYPQLTISLLQSLSSKVRIMLNQSVCVGMDCLSVRICKFLYQRLGNSIDEKNNCVQTGLTQQELANLLSIHRVTLNKALRELERKNILSQYSRDAVYILDIDRFLQIIF